MRHRSSQDLLRQNINRGIQKAQGNIPDAMGQSFSALIRSSYPEPSKLPSITSTSAMQNNAGATLFRLDYSATDGDHVLG